MEVVLEAVRGGAIFPTGKTFALSPEKSNFIDGLGAIKSHSYYAGENCIIAKVEGLPVGELVITGVGKEFWDNQVLNELMPPPSLMAPPLGNRSYSIGIDLSGR